METKDFFGHYFIYVLAVPARDFPGFCCPGDFVILGILVSWGFWYPGDFALHNHPSFDLVREESSGEKNMHSLGLISEFFLSLLGNH